MKLSRILGQRNLEFIHLFKMGLHSLNPTPDDVGLGRKVETNASGFGAIKTAYDLGQFAYDAASFAAPYAAAVGRGAMQLGRAALPLISAAL